jgi:hypothetical protein
LFESSLTLDCVGHQLSLCIAPLHMTSEDKNPYFRPAHSLKSKEERVLKDLGLRKWSHLPFPHRKSDCFVPTIDRFLFHKHCLAGNPDQSL